MERDTAELEFALQLWNKLNWYLFMYIDSTILIDFLMILLSNSKRKAVTAAKYLQEISKADDLSPEEIEENKKRNSELVLKEEWSVEQLFDYFKRKLNWPSIVARTGFSIENSEKKQRLINEHYKECTFKPQVSVKVREADEKKISMSKINQSLEALNINKQDVDQNIYGDKDSRHGSGKKLSARQNKKTPGKLINGI